MPVTHIPATQLLTKRGELLRRCSRDKEHFVIELHEVPIVTLIPYEEYKLWQSQSAQKNATLSEPAPTNTSASLTQLNSELISN